MSSQTVFIRLPSPLSPLHLTLPPCLPLSDIPLPPSLSTSQTYLRTPSSLPLDPSTRISSLRHVENPAHPIRLELGVRLLGGKGGFGTQLRAAGGRMSASKATNVDSCRDLSGRRLGTIKEAQRQAELLESAPALRAAAKAAEKAKLEALERQLGINAAESSASTSTEAGPSSSSGSKRIADVDLEELAKKKHKFEDSKFLEESREINDNVRSAVSAAMLLKKKKKAKADAANASSTKSAIAVNAAKKAEKDKVAMPPPAVSTAASAVPAA